MTIDRKKSLLEYFKQTLQVERGLDWQIKDG
jgi:hypothetical protein